MGAELDLYEEFREELHGDEFPLYSEETAPQGSAEYQKCRTGTRFWRAYAAKSAGGEWRVYATVHGPRGTEHGWTGYGPDGARRVYREIMAAAIGRLPVGKAGLVLAPWYAQIKSGDHHYVLTKAEALSLAFTLGRLADEAEEQARVGFSSRLRRAGPAWRECRA